MVGIALLLAAAAVAYAAARALRISPVPLLLLAGTALGGAVDTHLLDDALILGVTFLIFVAGVELGPGTIARQRRRVLVVGLVQFLALGISGFLVATALGIDPVSGAFIALALTASSALVIVRLLRQRRQMYEPFARLVVGVLLLQNLLVIALIPALSIAPRGATAVGVGLAGVALLGAMAFVTGRWVTPWLLRLDREDEPLVGGDVRVPVLELPAPLVGDHLDGQVVGRVLPAAAGQLGHAAGVGAGRVGGVARKGVPPIVSAPMASSEGKVDRPCACSGSVV